jgi:hypothetical protein
MVGVRLPQKLDHLGLILPIHPHSLQPALPYGLDLALPWPE